MNKEAEGKTEEAAHIFHQAWEEAATDWEKFIAAHYVARQQKTVAEKLKWDTTALELALKIKDNSVKGAYPSLYLNIGKCYEDLKDMQKALKHYKLALSFVPYLKEDGYGKMIKAGIDLGIERVQSQ